VSHLIENPCAICDKPSRSCGHTRADRREHILKCLELRRLTYHAPEKKRGHHKVKGSEVFPHDESHSHVAVPVSGKVLRLRMADVPMVRLVTDDEYADGGKDAA
jgi:hypothetical protein